RDHVEGLADLVPAVPGLAGGADVLAGGVPCAALDVPRGTCAHEGVQVADGQVRTAERLPGDELGAAVPGQADECSARGVGCPGPPPGTVDLIWHRGVLLRRARATPRLLARARSAWRPGGRGR